MEQLCKPLFKTFTLTCKTIPSFHLKLISLKGCWISSQPNCYSTQSTQLVHLTGQGQSVIREVDVSAFKCYTYLKAY